MPKESLDAATTVGQSSAWPTELRAVLAELFGTFALTFVAAGATMVTAVSHHELDFTAKVAAPGLLVMAMIYTFGDQSGAHINPAVTLAFALRRAFSWLRVPGYWLAQFAGALLAAFVLRRLLGNVEHLGATVPHGASGEALGFEIILTLFLVTVIIGTATGHRVVGPNAGISVGATIILCGMVGAPISGASMNPAVSFGPAFLGQTMDTYWIYLLGPVSGSVLAVVLNFLTHGSPTDHERKAASGKGEKPD